MPRGPVIYCSPGMLPLPGGRTSLLKALEQVTDPRARRGIRHNIASTLAMVVAAGLSGSGRSFRSVGDFAADLPQDALARYRRADGEFADTTLERVVVDDLVAGLPVREFRWYRDRRHYSGWYWSSTMGGLVAYESRLELARVMLADYDRNVAAIAAQPFQLAGADGRRLRRHVPDFLLLSPAGEVTVVDVKTAGKMAEPSVRGVFAWTRELAGWRGWGFEAWSGADRRLLDNVVFLAGYRRQAVIAAPLIPAVLAAASTQQSIGAIEHALSGEHPPALTRPVVLHLLWAGRLEADLASPLSASTVVQLREEVTG